MVPHSQLEGDLPKTSDLNSKPSGAGPFQLSLRKQLLWPNCLLEDVQSHFYKAVIISQFCIGDTLSQVHVPTFLSAGQGQEILPFSH